MERLKIKYIGFDKDGTLTDSIPSYIKLWGEILQRDYNIASGPASKIFSETMGRPTTKQLKQVFEEAGVGYLEDEMFDRANKIAKELGVRSKGKVFPEVPKTLKEIKQLGYLIFISSGQQETIVKKDLKRNGIDKYIDLDLAIKSQDPQFKKGIPHFKAAALHFNVPYDEFVEETIFVGDTPEDIKISKEAGIRAIARTGTFTEEQLLAEKPDYVIKNLTEIFDILENIMPN